MVDHTAVRLGSPFVSFFLARLGVFLEFSGGRRPQMGLFVSRECAFRRVLLKLYPLIRHSLIQHHLLSEMAEEGVVGTEVRLSELDTGLSFSDNPVDMEVDTVMFKPFTSFSLKPFQALIEECVLEGKHMKSFRKHFQFPTEMKIRPPLSRRKGLCLCPRPCVFL